MSDLSYPIGKYEPVSGLSADKRAALIDDVASTPARMRAAVAGLDDAQLDTHYRPGGWTVRQVVHHVADSHMNCLIRFKLALTEDEPTIKPYAEGLWAELDDTRVAPIDMSLEILDGVHRRWDVVLRAMKPDEFARRFRHPERGTVTLDDTLGLYAWHGRHHVAHITRLRDREGWS